jgi:hypothetical protein
VRRGVTNELVGGGIAGEAEVLSLMVMAVDGVLRTGNWKTFFGVVELWIVVGTEFQKSPA